MPRGVVYFQSAMLSALLIYLLIVNLLFISCREVQHFTTALLVQFDNSWSVLSS